MNDKGLLDSLGEAHGALANQTKIYNKVCEENDRLRKALDTISRLRACAKHSSIPEMRSRYERQMLDAIDEQILISVERAVREWAE